MEAAPVPRAADTRRHVLTAVEFDVLWERLGLGPTPVVLRLESPERSRAERREVQAAGWQALRERGLAGPSGPHPEVTRLMHLLARPVEQLELRGWWGRSVRVVAAGRTEVNVLAVRQDRTVSLEPCTCLPSALLGTLPPAGPGPGRPSTVPTDVLAAAAGVATGGLRAALVHGGVPKAEATVLARMLDGTLHRSQIVALAGDRWGVTRRSGEVLGVLDGARGRYLVTRTVSGDGIGWTTVAPAGTRALRDRVGELLAATVAACP